MRIGDIKLKHVIIGIIILVILSLIGQSITSSRLEEKRQMYLDAVEEGLGY